MAVRGDRRSNKDVFINCPFDPKYQGLFEAIVFTVIACGYNPRCAREVTDASERLEFIVKLARECRLGIHDLSRERAARAGDYARFNLPFELGLQWAHRNGNRRILVFESKKYELQKALSDFNALDPRVHSSRKRNLIHEVREFLNGDDEDSILPGTERLTKIKAEFDFVLEARICRKLGISRKKIGFADYVRSAAAWIEKKSQSAK